MSDDWKRYPWTPDWGDAREFGLPAADGHRPELGAATYFVDGFLTGRRSGRQWAFMTIFTDLKPLWGMVRASFFTMALYDCDERRYGTYTDMDFPSPPRIRRGYKLDAASGHLGLRYRAGAGEALWEHAHDAGGALRPFAWTLDLPGRDQHGVAMRLVLDVDAGRPPAPLGGREQGGAMMFLGIPRTFSYFQSGLTMRGDLAWGDVREEVEGRVGWIDRQWAYDDLSRHEDRHSSNYRNEWRVIQLENGWDMSCFHQYHRPLANVVVPWTGLSAQGPGPTHELRATPDVQLDVPEFIRSPGRVRGMSMLTEGPRWFPHRYRLRAPSWELDLSCEPLVDAPAHALPIEYWTGPVRVSGRCFGQEVRGLGFDERSNPWCRGFEVAAALRITAEHTPGIDPMVAFRAWEVEALALRDLRAAAAHAERYLAPLVAAQGEAARLRLAPLADDLRVTLSGCFKVLG